MYTIICEFVCVNGVYGCVYVRACKLVCVRVCTRVYAPYGCSALCWCVTMRVAVHASVRTHGREYVRVWVCARV